MSVLQTDATSGDLVRVAGGLVRITGAEEVLQGVRTVWRLIRGECPYAMGKGIRWFTEDGADGVFSKGVGPADIGGEFRAAALGVPGMVSIDELEFDQTDEQRRNRAADISFRGTYSLDDLETRIPFADSVTVGEI